MTTKRANRPSRLPADGDHPTLSKKQYAARLQPLQYRMRSVALSFVSQGIAGIVLIEGTDTAGKGGAIRRLTAELDPRHYDVWPIGPPGPEARRHHYLWRFWQRLPEKGQIAVFDRSWYGRVLVERVEGLTSAKRWRRAYAEIREFEQSLTDDGVRLVKIYLHVSAREQRKRLAERVETPYKRWKVSAADFRSHLLRDDYLAAAEDMFAHTGTDTAPWHVIAADNKRHARIEVLETVTENFARGLDLAPSPLDAETARLAREVLGEN